MGTATQLDFTVNALEDKFLTNPAETFLFSLTFNTGTRLTVHSDGTIDVDWTDLNPNIIFKSILDNAIWMLDEALCTEGQKIIMHPKLIPNDKGMHLRAIVFSLQAMELNEVLEQKITQARIMTVKYLDNIYESPRSTDESINFRATAPTLKDGCLPFLEHATSAVLTSTAKRRSPPSFTLEFDDVSIECKSTLKQPTTTLGKEIEVWVQGWVVGWTAQKKHCFILKPEKSRTPCIIDYDPDNRTSGWPPLRNVLDERILVQIKASRRVVDGTFVYTLIRTEPIRKLFDQELSSDSQEHDD